MKRALRFKLKLGEHSTKQVLLATLAVFVFTACDGQGGNDVDMDAEGNVTSIDAITAHKLNQDAKAAERADVREQAEIARKDAAEQRKADLDRRKLELEFGLQQSAGEQSTRRYEAELAAQSAAESADLRSAGQAADSDAKKHASDNELMGEVFKGGLGYIGNKENAAAMRDQAAIMAAAEKKDPEEMKLASSLRIDEIEAQAEAQAKLQENQMRAQERSRLMPEEQRELSDLQAAANALAAESRERAAAASRELTALSQIESAIKGGQTKEQFVEATKDPAAAGVYDHVKGLMDSGLLPGEKQRLNQVKDRSASEASAFSNAAQIARSSRSPAEAASRLNGDYPGIVPKLRGRIAAAEEERQSLFKKSQSIFDENSTNDQPARTAPVTPANPAGATPPLTPAESGAPRLLMSDYYCGGEEVSELSDCMQKGADGQASIYETLSSATNDVAAELQNYQDLRKVCDTPPHASCEQAKIDAKSSVLSALNNAQQAILDLPEPRAGPGAELIQMQRQNSINLLKAYADALTEAIDRNDVSAFTSVKDWNSLLNLNKEIAFHEDPDSVATLQMFRSDGQGFFNHELAKLDSGATAGYAIFGGSGLERSYDVTKRADGKLDIKFTDKYGKESVCMGVSCPE